MSNYLYNGWLKITEIYSRGKKYEKLEMHSAVSGLVVNKENKILLVKQFRPCIDKYIFEIPAGCLDVLGEGKEETLIRELKEECNIDESQIKNVTLIKEYYTSLGCSDSRSHIYFVDVDMPAENKKIENDDVEEIIWITYDEFTNMISDGTIQDNKTQRAYEFLKEQILLKGFL